jgi:hypothetical protein
MHAFLGFLDPIVMASPIEGRFPARHSRVMRLRAPFPGDFSRRDEEATFTASAA